MSDRLQPSTGFDSEQTDIAIHYILHSACYLLKLLQESLELPFVAALAILSCLCLKAAKSKVNGIIEICTAMYPQTMRKITSN